MASHRVKTSTLQQQALCKEIDDFIAIDDMQLGSPSSSEAPPHRSLQGSSAAEELSHQGSAAWQIPLEFEVLLLQQDLL